MNDEILSAVERILEKQNGFARTRDFISAGISPYYVKRLESMGEIVRVKQGIYRHSNQKSEPMDEIIEVSKLVPKGVFCLLSALSYYGLTTYNPWEYQIAIHRGGKKPKLPDYPPIKIIYLADAQFNIGIDEIQIEGSAVKIYDREKSILRYRSVPRENWY
jgi:predicted transcriptional regulator of viral defense system